VKKPVSSVVDKRDRKLRVFWPFDFSALSEIESSFEE